MLVLHFQVKTLKVILAVRNVANGRYILKGFNLKKRNIYLTRDSFKQLHLLKHYLY